MPRSAHVLRNGRLAIGFGTRIKLTCFRLLWHIGRSVRVTAWAPWMLHRADPIGTRRKRSLKVDLLALYKELNLRCEAIQKQINQRFAAAREHSDQRFSAVDQRFDAERERNELPCQAMRDSFALLGSQLELTNQRSFSEVANRLASFEARLEPRS